mgnify:CR=1 FL=1
MPPEQGSGPGQREDGLLHVPGPGHELAAGHPAVGWLLRDGGGRSYGGGVGTAVFSQWHLPQTRPQAGDVPARPGQDK